ncbi:hypothetical protein ELE36_10780 [Pseudolysobacter antarcticus]|uniref:CBM-cenC domain-containing protein n=1 Tax=Pseudolysobacter antarcticus TaxID=2511995 RepID=A0A411HJT1_9GAMM|nr:hypothetical protein [Pseudolysobacter antarcticus]QBB70799.1 hypothetical protein ELE36_10780 [Pseudolysobacter antarcticus]
MPTIHEQNRTVHNATAAGIVATCHVSLSRNRSMKLIVMLSVLLGFSASSFAAEIALVNPGFETPMQGEDIPGWTQLQHAGIAAYEMGIDSKIFHGGKHSFRMKRIAEQMYGLLEQTVPVVGVGGKDIELSAMLRSEGVGKEGWRLSVNFMTGSGDILTQANSAIVTGTKKSWRRVVLLAKAPAGTTSISVGLLLQDRGTIWADDIHLRAVEK